jgi:DNA gyrase subunit B
MPKARAYDASNIESLSDVEAVKTKASMYIGALDHFGKWIMLKEIIDNARDEAGDGHANLVYVKRLGDERFGVYDNGRGIPVDMHKTNVPAIQLVFCKLHAGGKMHNDKNSVYKKTIGVHGVGACITNALSTYLKAFSYRHGWHAFECKTGEPVRYKKATVRKANLPDYVKSDALVRGKGSYVEFEIDNSRFGCDPIPDDTIETYLRLLSDFYPKVRFVYADEEGVLCDVVNKRSLEAKVAADNGVSAKNVLHVQTKEVNAILCFSRKTPIKDALYVAGSPTPDGGTHWNGLLRAVELAVAPYVKKDTFKAEAIAESLSGILNIELNTPEFKGQTKQRLETKEAMAMVRDALKGPLTAFFASNKQAVNEAIKLATTLHALEQKQKRELDLVKAVTGTRNKSNLPVKLSACPNCAPEKRELYLLEGDSAGNTAKIARNKAYQETLPLRGKFLNVVRNDSRAGDSTLVQDLLRSIGYSKDDPEMKKARVGKIMLLTDADSDGSHIQILLLGFLHRYVPQAFKRGVYIVDMPLYSLAQDHKKYYGNSLSDLRKQVKTITGTLTRFKGLGELNPDQLRELAFSPARKLIRVQPLREDEKAVFYGLMSGNADIRKDMLSYNPDNQPDNQVASASKPKLDKMSLYKRLRSRLRA